MMRSDGIKKRPGGTAILLAFVLFLFFPAAAYAQEGTAAAAETDGVVHIYDEAGLLSGSESEQLEQRCQQIETQSQIHILMVTTEDTQGKSQMEYADDFYDDIYPEKKDENGVLVLIDIGERELWISTAGIMRYYLSDQEIDRLLDDMYEEATVGDYAGAFEEAADHVELAIGQGISSGDYLVDENGRVTRYRRITGVELVLAGAVGLAAFCLVFFGVRHSYRKKVKSDMRGYGRVGGMKLDRQRDTLINRRVTSRKIVNNPPPGSGGGSSVHTSSSGRSHGGGGRGF